MDDHTYPDHKIHVSGRPKLDAGSFYPCWLCKASHLDVREIFIESPAEVSKALVCIPCLRALNNLQYKE